MKNLTPQAVWKYFDEITKIPRPSRKEEKMIAYLMDFAKKNNLEAKTDKTGNVLIKKKATPGKEQSPTVILQSHIDMVCEKNADVNHDFDKDPIQTYIEDGWVKARGTTLGGDDGIGVASAMAILTDKEIAHGPIEALFTVDEETGMTGAFGLEKGFMEGKILINLDSEDEGELFIGCAGGVDTVATFNYKRKEPAKKSRAFKITVEGLKGGHSGDDISKGLGNSNKILTRILLRATDKCNIRLHNFDGGNLRNAIPREACAIFTVKEKQTEKLQKLITKISTDIKNEFKVTEPDLQITCTATDTPKWVLGKKTQNKLLRALQACHHGVFSMSADMPGLVETSSNLASVKFKEDNTIKVETSQRSSVESAKYYMAEVVGAAFKQAGAKVKHGDEYPGWKPNVNSKVLKVTEAAYLKLFGNKPIVRAIHAGLECGLFLEKYPYLDMISFGPTIRGAHSPDERMEIATVEKFQKLLVEVLAQL
ncbi:MAG: cytosol nonspecific dipeptidase [Bacteroidia bacterium]|nr:MAG: cytosol nonspecific dipeptidase [Bacteroidia bacterium]